MSILEIVGAVSLLFITIFAILFTCNKIIVTNITLLDDATEEPVYRMLGMALLIRVGSPD